MKRYLSSLGLGVLNHSASDSVTSIASYGSLLGPRRKAKYNLLQVASLFNRASGSHFQSFDSTLHILKLHPSNNAYLMAAHTARSIQDGCNPTVVFQTTLGTGRATSRSNKMLRIKLELRASVLPSFNRHRVWKYGYGRTGKHSAAIRDLGQVSLVTKMGSISVSSSIFNNN